MRIRAYPGGSEICLDCGAHQYEIDPIQHESLCDEIREEQGWPPVDSVDQIRFEPVE